MIRLRKIVISGFILTVLSIQTLCAQSNLTDFRTIPNFGIRMGANYSKVYAIDGEDFTGSPKFGFVTGYFASIPFGKYFGIQPEFLFSEKGFKATGRLLGATYKVTRTTSYIDIPVLFAYKPTEGITILGGPQYSFLLQERDVYSNNSITKEQEFAFANSTPRRNLFSVATGFDFTFSHIVIGTRANWGLISSNNNGSSTTPQYKNFWYQLTAGYRF